MIIRIQLEGLLKSLKRSALWLRTTCKLANNFVEQTMMDLWVVLIMMFQVNKNNLECFDNQIFLNTSYFTILATDFQELIRGIRMEVSNLSERWHALQARAEAWQKHLDKMVPVSIFFWFLIHLTNSEKLEVSTAGMSTTLRPQKLALDLWKRNPHRNCLCKLSAIFNYKCHLKMSRNAEKAFLDEIVKFCSNYFLNC